MDVSPQDVRDVQFREKMRGYHQDDVDQFLVQVASTLERLQLRVHDAEARAAEGASKHDELATTEESLKRTLLLAQRTADLAMQEAREEADRLLADARAEHERLTTESEAIKRQLVDESQADIRSELTALEARRDGLLRDVAALEGYVDAERSRLAEMLRETLRHLDDGSFAASTAPDLSEQPETPDAGVDAPVEGAADRAGAVDVAAGVVPDATPLDDGDGPPTEMMAALNGHQHEEQAPEPVILDEAMAPSPQPGEETGSAAAELDLREEAERQSNDAFLAELRRAVTDDEPLGPRAEDAAERAHDDEEIDFYQRDREASGRFGSRLRRRR